MNGAVRPETSKANEPSLAVAVVRLLPAGEESLRVTVPATGPPVAAVPVSAAVTAVVLPVPLLPVLPPLHAATASKRAIANEARKTYRLRNSGRPMAIPFSDPAVCGADAPCDRC